jgi:hypothetical protein
MESWQDIADNVMSLHPSRVGINASQIAVQILNIQNHFGLNKGIKRGSWTEAAQVKLREWLASDKKRRTGSPEKPLAILDKETKHYNIDK